MTLYCAKCTEPPPHFSTIDTINTAASRASVVIEVLDSCEQLIRHDFWIKRGGALFEDGGQGDSAASGGTGEASKWQAAAT